MLIPISSTQLAEALVTCTYLYIIRSIPLGAFLVFAFPKMFKTCFSNILIPESSKKKKGDRGISIVMYL